MSTSKCAREVTTGIVLFLAVKIGSNFSNEGTTYLEHPVITFARANSRRALHGSSTVSALAPANPHVTFTVGWFTGTNQQVHLPCVGTICQLASRRSVLSIHS